MKKIVLSLFALAMFSFTSNAQTLDEIIAKNIAARGGLEKLKNLKTIIVESSINAQGMEIPIKVTMMHNTGFKMDMSLMGMDNYMLVNKKEGVQFFPIRGQTTPEALPEDMVKNFVTKFDLQGEFIDTKEKGINLTLQGEEDVDGTMCFKILCVFPNKTEKRIFIDKESYQVIKEVEKSIVNGKEMEESSEYSNFQTVDGYTMAYNASGQMGMMKTTKLQVNPKIEPSFFEVKK